MRVKGFLVKMWGITFILSFLVKAMYELPCKMGILQGKNQVKLCLILLMLKTFDSFHTTVIIVF